jgi:hypothetical protein
VIKSLKSWWRGRQRRIDIDVLWPMCKRQAGPHGLERARAAFHSHVMNRVTWRVMGRDRITAVVAALE